MSEKVGDILREILKFRDWLNSSRINPFYNISYCPGCKDIRLVDYYSPDDNYCSPHLRRMRMRFKPCGHDFDQEDQWQPVIKWPKEMQKKYKMMSEPESQLKLLKEKLAHLKQREALCHRLALRFFKKAEEAVEKIKIPKEKITNLLKGRPFNINFL